MAPTAQCLSCCRFGTKQLLQFLYVACLTCLLVVAQTSSAKGSKHCPASSCGNIRNISYPFRLVTDPLDCGELIYNLSCESNQTILYLFNGKYKVQAINYQNLTIRLVDVNVDKTNCSSVPRFPLSWRNFSYGQDTYTQIPNQNLNFSDTIIITSCRNPAKSDSSLYIDTSPCFNGVNSSNSTQWNRYIYVQRGSRMTASDLMDSCRIDMISFLPPRDYTNLPFIDIHRELGFGFELSWDFVFCMVRCSGLGNCYADSRQVHCKMLLGPDYIDAIIRTVMPFLRNWMIWQTVFQWFACIHAAFFVFIAPCIFVLLIRKFRRRHCSAYDAIEDFLHNQNNLMPIRYSYSNIKKMTSHFKDKLGEGGFGSVYKGRLRSGHLAAIKMLGKSKSNGQDFINEVATIGRIHHTNVVQLIGYCVEGSKRALVYDFMPNGSLDKYIFGKEGYASLTWDKLYDISLGIARGIEYLHQGCDMQILHFDIKPHNILLDENFNPKLCDFGLAKLYPTNNSILSITAARGTIGYMAPELFYKNIGRISYKADIYSFGMMLMEIAGRRKNLNAEAEKTSEIYFPLWIYDQLVVKNTIEIGEVEEEENKMIKKMIMVGLWCIQMRPTDRPSMSKVIEMVEGDLENLQLPPRPLLYPEETPFMEQSFEEGITSSDDAL